MAWSCKLAATSGQPPAASHHGLEQCLTVSQGQNSSYKPTQHPLLPFSHLSTVWCHKVQLYFRASLFVFINTSIAYRKSSTIYYRFRALVLLAQSVTNQQLTTYWKRNYSKPQTNLNKYQSIKNPYKWSLFIVDLHIALPKSLSVQSR